MTLILVQLMISETGGVVNVVVFFEVLVYSIVFSALERAGLVHAVSVFVIARSVMWGGGRLLEKWGQH